MVPPALEPPTPDDATLAIRAAGGDAMAQAAIWDRHATLVRRILTRALGSSVDLEDLVQEVFLALHCNRSRLREPNALRSYIYGIALRVAGTELRARRMRACLCLTPDGTIDRFEAPPADPDAWQAVRRLQDILQSLEDESRVAFVLSYVEGLEHTEVAAAMGVSLATIKRKLARISARVFARAQSDHVLSSLTRVPAKALGTTRGRRRSSSGARTPGRS